VQTLRQGAGEVPVAHGTRRHGVHGAAHRRVGANRLEQPGEVVRVDPRHPLASVSERSAQAQPEELTQSCEGTSFPSENQTDPQGHHANAVGLGSSRRRLPVAAQIGEEPGPRHRLLGDLLLCAIAVDPHCGGTDEDRRPVGGREPADGSHDRLRRGDAARHHALSASGGRDPREDRLTSQVDHRIGTRESTFGQRTAVPLDRLGRSRESIRSPATRQCADRHLRGEAPQPAPSDESRRAREEKGVARSHARFSATAPGGPAARTLASRGMGRRGRSPRVRGSWQREWLNGGGGRKRRAQARALHCGSEDASQPLGQGPRLPRAHRSTVQADHGSRASHRVQSHDLLCGGQGLSAYVQLAKLRE
jgi:hypothetical protein